jgi:serine/threonine-protein kinase HipA
MLSEGSAVQVSHHGASQATRAESFTLGRTFTDLKTCPSLDTPTFHQRGGIYVLTPLYDVLSAWPVIGHGRNELPLERAKLATAIRGRSPHYRIGEITGRHWRELSQRVGIVNLWDRMQTLVAEATMAIERLESKLPPDFPDRVYARIRAGVLRQARRFADTAALD